MTKFYDLTKALAAALFKKPSPIVPDGALKEDTAPGKVLAEMRALFAEKKFVEADERLHASYVKSEPVIMAAALDFYARLSELDEEELTANGFTVDRIGQGLADMMNFYDVKLQKQDPGAPQPLMVEPEEGKSQFWSLTKALANAVFKQPSQLIPDGALKEDTVPGKFYAELRALLDAKKFAEADAKLQAAYDKTKPIFAQFALDYYTRASEFTKEELEAAGYSHEKVGLGLAEMLKAYEIKLQKQDPNEPQPLVVKPEEGKSHFYNLTKAMAATLFKQPSQIIPDGTIKEDTEVGKFYYALRALLDEKKLGDAEDMLKAAYNKEKPVFAQIALDFYGRISELPEEELLAHDFTGDRIGHGLDDMLKAYDIKIQRRDPNAPDPEMMKPDPEKSQHWNLCKFLAAGVFKKPSPIIPDGAIPAGSEAGIVWARLRQLIDARSINTAENLLFDSFDKEKPIYAAIALDFYARLSDLSEDDLHECSFSTEEIGEGIRDMMKFYDIKIAMQKPGAKPGEQPAAPEAKESNE